MNYPRIQALYRLSPAEIEEHIDLLTAAAEIVDPVPGEPVVRKDPQDDPVVYTAVTGRADVLCTLDRDFYDPPVVDFFSGHNIAVMADVELLRSL